LFYLSYHFLAELLNPNQTSPPHPWEKGIEQSMLHSPVGDSPAGSTCIWYKRNDILGKGTTNLLRVQGKQNPY